MKDINFDLLNDDNYLNADLQLKHLKIIRYRLMKGRERYNSLNKKRFSRNSTVDELNAHGITISLQTYDTLFDPKCERRSIDISAVVYICKLLDLDVTQVLAFPEETIVDAKKNPPFNNLESRFKVFDDLSYNGKFYFYFFRYAGTDSSFYKEYPDTLCKTEDVFLGTLFFDIQKDSGSIAKLNIEMSNTLFDNTKEICKKTATCIPMLSTINNNVYLRFVDNDGKTYQIVFDRQNSNKKCFFRIAGMFIESSDDTHLPIFQKILLLRKELQPEQYKYIRGALNLNQDTVVISEKKLNDLAKEDPEIQTFMECYGEKIKSYKKEVLVFHKNIILSDDSDMSKEKRTSVLLKLWHHTFSQNIIPISGGEFDYKIFKELQQESEKQNLAINENSK